MKTNSHPFPSLSGACIAIAALFAAMGAMPVYSAAPFVLQGPGVARPNAQTLRISIAPGSVHLFDAKSGARL